MDNSKWLLSESKRFELESTANREGLQTTELIKLVAQAQLDHAEPLIREDEHTRTLKAVGKWLEERERIMCEEEGVPYLRARYTEDLLSGKEPEGE